MLTRIIKKISGMRQEGMALLLAIISTAIMGFIGASFAIMVSNEARSVNSNILAQKALYVAESGISDVMFQRSKMPAEMCFPYFYDATTTVQVRLNRIKDLTGSVSGGATLDIGASTTSVCNPKADNIPPATTFEELPCWPYNEKLYANVIHWGPDYKCHDGSFQGDNSDGTSCSAYQPFLWWPAKTDGTIGWKDWDESLNTSHLPLTNTSQSTGARYTTGFFTLCTDDYYGIAAGDPGYDNSCTDAKSGGTCPQSVVRLSIVSVGEVQIGETIIRRAVKTDMAPPALYSGVIDKYVDMTGLMQGFIKGPLHINGWQNANKWQALLGGSFSLAGIVGMFDSPDMISVSYPEDPANPDPQPGISGFSLSHEITWIHLPVRINIPDVNWNKWEKRMKDLYARANSEYNDGNVYALKRCKFGPLVKATNLDCGDAGEQYPLSAGQNDQSMDDSFPRYNCPPNAGTDRIHNCNADTYQLWNSSNKHIFDLFDQWDAYAGSYVEGTEPSELGGGMGPRDKSLMYKVKFMLNPSFGLGCLTCVIGGGFNLASFLSCCVGKEENRHEFAFMGKHEFRDFVFIDGVMGMGSRTPYHSCGPGDGGLSLYCIVIPSWCLPWPLDSVCIPGFSFGLPHWHIGEALVTGEVLVNGRLYMADWIRIDGGTIYADNHIIKDETSGYDIEVNLSTMLCWLLGGIFSLNSTICDIVMFIPNLLLANAFSWWPILNLTNNDFIDFETYLDIDGLGPPYPDGLSRPNASAVVNPGTLYTRGDFRYLNPNWDALSFIANAVLGSILPFINLVPAVDPIRIYNGGAIVAGGTATGGGGGSPDYQDGNIFLDKNERMDILTVNPMTDETSYGYAFARGGVRVWGDIISQYKSWGGLTAKGCGGSATGWTYDEDCGANGIFYSGGIAAGANPLAGIGNYTLDIGQPSGSYEKEISITCPSFEESAFWADILGSVGCLGGALLDFATTGFHEYNIKGHIFAGQAGAMIANHVTLTQDSSVRADAVTRNYFKNLSGVPIDWMEISVPPNLPKLPD
ncbi:MAG: hypothetical protein WCX65_17105 [bacterium]